MKTQHDCLDSFQATIFYVKSEPLLFCIDLFKITSYARGSLGNMPHNSKYTS